MKSIQVTEETKDRLIALGGKDDSHEDVIKRLLDARVRCRNIYGCSLGVGDKII